ncbi:MAG: YeeE/YedE family protein [Phycisphaeraceae bacterium]|nr:YeeE/YedE family protein [Phycisphaeraceae bacterium]
MFSNFFADPTTLLLGAITGLVFGFLLQKGGVTRYNVIVRQFLFRDFTVLKTMLTAIIVGAIGIYAMLALGMIEGLHVKTAALMMNLLGGAIFGVGMVLLGYCPGTAVAAAGQGSRDALVGIAGGLVGALAYAEAYPWISKNIEPVANFGKITFPGISHVSPWLFIVPLALIASALFYWLERREHTVPRAA